MSCERFDERFDGSEPQIPNQYLFSVGVVELLVGISATSGSIPNGYGFAINALSTLAYGAIGGLIIGCLMVATERGVQKCSKEHKEQDTIALEIEQKSNFVYLGGERLLVTVALSVEFKELLETRNTTKTLEDI